MPSTASGPPAFGWLVDTAGYHAGWALVAGSLLAGCVLLAVVRRRA